MKFSDAIRINENDESRDIDYDGPVDLKHSTDFINALPNVLGRRNSRYIGSKIHTIVLPDGALGITATPPGSDHASEVLLVAFPDAETADRAFDRWADRDHSWKRPRDPWIDFPGKYGDRSIVVYGANVMPYFIYEVLYSFTPPNG